MRFNGLLPNLLSFGAALLVVNFWKATDGLRSRYLTKDDHLGIGFKDLDHYHPAPIPGKMIPI